MQARSLTLLSAATLALTLSLGAQAQTPKLSHQDSSFLKDAAVA